LPSTKTSYFVTAVLSEEASQLASILVVLILLNATFAGTVGASESEDV